VHRSVDGTLARKKRKERNFHHSLRGDRSSQCLRELGKHLARRAMYLEDLLSSLTVSRGIVKMDLMRALRWTMVRMLYDGSSTSTVWQDVT